LAEKAKVRASKGLEPPKGDLQTEVFEKLEKDKLTMDTEGLDQINGFLLTLYKIKNEIEAGVFNESHREQMIENLFKSKAIV
jgi:hypothetical protein